MTDPLSQILTACALGVLVFLVLCAVYADRRRW